ncbi:stage II sporulation protein D [Anaerotignum lactatifermentans]|uniref:Stage II sporulation protein D n=1 Tax=Anaerotignum lactatifermentans TaxID=160404 RepID=A0ABS2G8N6_9FIRM|nr:stage II sporulation protein D [Anaerotignum lactatifermentans]MBM6829161.1 stage II sporulation protein D [Anaerotignum lactatifermentans]MBM6877232.1 stage II sporulation protein D [Anaerotignum lactatifermentans]MBM6950605.1 stage II sporulation protein D [Anaerotignum lactatifermentans]
MAKKLAALLLLYGLLAVLAVPLMVTLAFGGFRQEAQMEARAIYGLTDFYAGQKAPSELEAYVLGVVSAEMPASFPLEALKAQAVAARTYELRKMEEAGSEEVLYDIGQAYCTEEERRQKWGGNYETYLAKMEEAVGQTAGEIMVYEEEPILAVFHAQSGGRTEDSENVWVQEIPYLRGVDSEGDEEAPGFETEARFSAEEVWRKLSQYGELGVSAAELDFSHAERSKAGYIQTIQAGNLALEGQQIRNALGLRSTNFTVKRQGDEFVFTTKGYGHGAGMSQYGAKALAEEGRDYHEILLHYYTGVSFENIA